MLQKDQWYVCNKDHKVVLGPFATEDEAKAKVRTGTDDVVCQAKDDKTFTDGHAETV